MKRLDMSWPMILLLLCGSVNFLSLYGNEAQSNRNESLKRRQKRYLIFEKGSTFTVQTNIAKSVIPGVPRGLNEITEYTLAYDLPTELRQLKIKTNPLPTTKARTSTTKNPNTIYYPLGYYSHDISRYPTNEHHGYRKYWKVKAVRSTRCDRWHFYQLYGRPAKMCLKRIKRISEMHRLTTSQRVFYDIIKKWSKMEGYLPRYCFMRTLCEAPHVLLPHGYSLLHDIIRILLRFTTPWALQHETFGRSLEQGYRIDECAALYGPHCRVSWLDYVTTEVHGSDFNIIH